MNSLKDVLLEGEIYLSEVGLETAKNDAWYLFEYVFEMKRAEFILYGDRAADAEKAFKFFDFIKIRATRKPLQYITRHQEFMGFDFEVNESVLIPRQDTEVLVEKSLEIINKFYSSHVQVLDMCTGSGCIAVSISKLAPKAKLSAADISGKVLELAKKNAAKHEAKCDFIQSNLFNNIEGKFDVIISNPPYIRTDVIDKLMEEVKGFEPITALDGGSSGLEFYRTITQESVNFLNKDGFLLYEIGYDQAEDVVEILKSFNYREIEVFKDLAGLDRVVKARYMEA